MEYEDTLLDGEVFNDISVSTQSNYTSFSDVGFFSGSVGVFQLYLLSIIAGVLLASRVFR